MGHKVKQSLMGSRIDFFYYAFRNVLLVSIPLLIVSSVVLSHLSFHSAATGSSSGSTSSTDSLSFSISSSCTLSSVVDSSHTAELINGTYTNGIGKTTITTLCNDGNGYSVYAVGYSNNEEGNNRLVNTESSNFNIVSGTAESGNTSNWAMSLNNLKDDPSLTPPTITLGYDGIYGIVPDRWTKVASLPARATDMIKGSSFTTTYAVYTSSSQYAGTYNGQVKYMLVHPSSPSKNLTMQSIATWKDAVLPNEGDSIQAVDERDGKKYWVTKLKDGHIWMTQNLDLDINTTTPLNSNTTDITVLYDIPTGNYREYLDGYTINNGIIYWQPENTAITINFQNTTVTDWINDNSNPYSANKTDDVETGHASLGNYYNWTAAIASNDSSSLEQDTLNDISKNPKNSICPKGWRLPTISNQSGTTIDSNNEFARLNYLYNNNYTNKDTGLLSSPLYFGKTGYIGINANTGSGFLNANSTGYYWSNTTGNNSGAYNFHFNSNSVQTDENYGVRYNGFPIRCVAR